MLNVDEALKLICDHAQPRAPHSVLISEVLGLALAEDVVSDLDSPPYDRSNVDGYALQAAELKAGRNEFMVLEQIVAGALPTQPVTSGTATRIMTGAPVPAGADSIVMFERTELLSGDGPWGRVRINNPRLAAEKNITRRGASMRQGEIVLRRGHVVRSIEIGLLAEVGRTSVLAVPRPVVAVLSTGNELVPAAQTPGPTQIRNTNGPMLAACVAECGAEAVDLGIGRDDPDELRALVKRGLAAADVLVASGGVSAGVLDLLPGVLVDLGLRQVFHQVRVKPGKPIWFGVYEHDIRRRLVFGLPGNPVSSYVCFQLFVRLALECLGGRADLRLAPTNAALGVEYVQRGDRPTYRPAHVTISPQGAVVQAVAWQGSSDLAGLTRANALAYFPAGDRKFQVGEPIEVFLLGGGT